LTADGRLDNRDEQLERIAQLERSLARLAEQVEQLRQSLRQ
jgi:hypothetical protein